MYRVPAVMTHYARNAQSLLQTVHHDIEICARRLGVGVASLHTLSQQLTVYKGIFDDIATMGKEFVISKQKEINREISPVIMRAMIGGYNACEAESGTLLRILV